MSDEKMSTPEEDDHDWPYCSSCGGSLSLSLYIEGYATAMCKGRLPECDRKSAAERSGA